jgi:hypothetical protein
MDSARHVIERVSNPHFLSYMATYDVASSVVDSACHVIERVLNPHFLSWMASYDVEYSSSIHESLVGGIGGEAEGGEHGQVHRVGDESGQECGRGRALRVHPRFVVYGLGFRV